MTGRLITFEGTEGTGKSTQVELLAGRLRRAGRDVIVTREPGGTPLGCDLRRLLLGRGEAAPSPAAELFLYLADRAQHAAGLLRPALEKGAVVLCDRFADATIAYQGYGRGLDIEFLHRANRLALGDLRPSLTVLLDLADPSVGVGRSLKRHAREGTVGAEDRFEMEASDFHRRVQEGYRALAAAEPERFLVVDAGEPPASLHERIIPVVERILDTGT